MRRALSCVSNAQLFVTRGKQPGELEALTLNPDPLPLYSGRIQDTIQFRLGHQFRLVQDGRKSWSVSTAAYQYHLLDASGAELIGWHWHPGTSVRPHLHVPADPIDRRVHIPTGRVSIESVLRLLLTDLKVEPTREHADDFEQVLSASEGPFVEHRRWHDRSLPSAVFSG